MIRAGHYKEKIPKQDTIKARIKARAEAVNKAIIDLLSITASTVTMLLDR